VHLEATPSRVRRPRPARSRGGGIVFGRRDGAGTMARAARTATIFAAIASMLGLTAVGVVTGESPVGAVGPARNGLTEATASPSCWSIKQSYPASVDGVYWLWTPSLVKPQQFYCDMTTDGGGWVLIGRGREGWTFPYWGQGSPSTVRTTITGPDAFSPATLSTPIVDGLLNGGRMDGLTDGLRLRRATNPTGTTWQEVRMMVRDFGKWSWAFGGGIRLSSIRFDGTTTNITTSGYQTGTTANVQVQNDTRRVTTVPQSGHNFQGGFSYGGNVTNGSNSATSYLWEYANENSAIPFTQLFVRPRITETDITNQGVTYAPDTGIAGYTVRPMVDKNPTAQPWAVTGINFGQALSNLHAYVKSFAQIGNTLYMGGKFLQVQHGVGGPTFTQSYLAAFDVNTGEWIPSFNPVVDAPVWKLMAAPDGSKLFVGGEFTNINGVANTNGLAAVNPATGAPVAGNVWQSYVGKPSGVYDVRAMSIQGNWLYLGGDFTQITGGTGFDTAGPLTLARLARVQLSNGRPDFTWMPRLDTAPQDMFASPQGDRVYLVGGFSVLNDVTLNPNHQAIINTTDGARVTGLNNWVPTQNGTPEPSNTILEDGNHVYQGGSQHYLHSYSRSNYTLERHHATQNAGGDFQAMAIHDGILYAACHCVTDWQFQDGTGWNPPTNYGRVDPINLIGAYDLNDNQEVLPEFHPTQIRLSGSGGEGPWSLFFDSNDCMWAGGDLVRQGASANPYYGGYERFCQRDAAAPSVPNAKATVSGNDVTLTWPASTDNASTPIEYQILKDDPTFGTMVVASTFERTWTESNVVGNTRYFVRAVDATGNRSATTPVLSVTPPPPAVATLLAAGTSWSYNASGQDLGTTWRTPAFDTSSWPTGPAEFGWGDGDETTVLPSGTLTQYFVKHISVTNPSQYKTVSVRLKRDDGAVVYVNGVEVVRDNMPGGRISATTPASGFAAGADETRFFEYQVPASLFVNGDNTIAVELHQPDAANPDGTFDLELVARNGNETNAPSTPAPVAGNVTSSTLDLTWAASTDDVSVIGYVVRRNGTIVAFQTSTTFADFGLTPNTAYAYDVRAVDTSGNVSGAGTTNTTTSANTVLIQSGDVWSYQSGGSPDPTWKSPGFDDGAWATGPSQLGWGDGDEATVVPNATRTQYYIRHLQVDDPDPYQLLNLRLKRDDGAAVYVNGVEVVRSNLPAGTLLPTTGSSTAITGAANESAWHEFAIPGRLLVTGDNVIAAEVHQDANNDIDSSFDLELISQTPTETTPPSRPALSVNAIDGSSLGLTWTASTDDTGVLGYLLRRNGSAVAFTSATSFTDTGLAPNTQYSYQVFAIDTSGNRSTPGSLAVSTTTNPTIVDFGEGWSYRFDGVNQGSDWTAPSFDDSAWASGRAELGIGDADEATVIGPAVAPTPITAYFRHIFEVHDLGSIQALTMDVVRDDGFVAYLNGVEIGRSNMPAGPVAYTTRPSAGIADRNDEITPVTLAVPPSALVDGDNVLAVEMHQFNNTSNDLSFNLRLRATYAQAPVVTLTSPHDQSYVTTPSTTLEGLCTSTAGTVTIDVSGNDTTILTAPCVDNEWTASGPLADGAYTASASQTSGGVTGVSNGVDFIVDTSVPVVTITDPVAATLTGATPLLAGTCSEDFRTVRVALSGAASANLTTQCTNGSWSLTSSPLATGAYNATASQTNAAGTIGNSAARAFSVDGTAPTTTDNSVSIGSAWRATPATVTLSPVDSGGAGVGATYYTTNGDTPTTASSQGTSIVLSADGVYTIKYFSVDTLGNTEAVKTAGTQIRIDTQAPVTTDNTGTIGNGWKTTDQTVTLTPNDGTGSGAVATYYTTNGSTPTTGSAQGTSVLLNASGTFTIKYFSVDAAGNAEAVKTAGTVIQIDKNAPTTTDNTATVGAGPHQTAQTVTLTPNDTGGSGVAATYYTTNGSTPTTASSQGTSIVLSADGVYTIKYFSVDTAGNAEAAKTAGTVITINTSGPTNTMTFPVDNGRYNSTTWTNGGCPAGTARICGTASAGTTSVRVSIQRSSNNQWWTGSNWSNTQQSVVATGTTSWAIQVPTNQLGNGITYTVTSWSLQGAVQSPNTVRTFVYDTSAPTTSAAGLVTSNKNGAVEVGDTFSVTFNEAIDPASVAATSTLSLSRSFGNTSYAIPGLVNGTRTTNATGYVSLGVTTRTLNYAGTLTLSNNNQTVTFTVTGGCTGSSCGSATTSPSSGGFQYQGSSSLRDVAGNTASNSNVNAASTVMF
jgi:hypothetical protein